MIQLNDILMSTFQEKDIYICSSEAHEHDVSIPLDSSM